MEYPKKKIGLEENKENLRLLRKEYKEHFQKIETEIREYVRRSREVEEQFKKQDFPEVIQKHLPSN